MALLHFDLFVQNCRVPVNVAERGQDLAHVFFAAFPLSILI